MSRTLLLGLDGLTHKVLDPAFEAGHMPALSALLDRGVSGVLTSTVPPYTPPGWTSIFTGVNPGKHGVFGFRQGNVQRLGGIVNLTEVEAPTLWDAAKAQGKRMGIFNVPLTFPPPKLDGFAVTGMLTPEIHGQTPRNFTHPPELAEGIVGHVGTYEIDIPVRYEEDSKSTAIIDRLSRNVSYKRQALEYILQNDTELPFLFAVLESPDRLFHAHYKYLDPDCEHWNKPEATAIRERAWSFFDDMDAVIGDLVAWAGNDGYVVTVSDHGFGPKHKNVNVNLALREWGLLSVQGIRSVTKSSGVRKLASKVKKVVPKTAWQKVTGPLESAIDWSRTKAFSAPNPQQGIYVNLKGREPHGVVPENEYDALRDEIIERLTSLVDPDDGRPVVDMVYKREDVMSGPAASRGPDLFPVCRDYSYELHDSLHAPSVLKDFRHSPRGFHHMDGILGIAGPGVDSRPGVTASIYDIAPTTLYLAGMDAPPSDGQVLSHLLPEALIEQRPPGELKVEVGTVDDGEASPYSEAEEAEIEEALRNLGYL